MEMEAGKVFIGGISWETSEERLREYFKAFGEVIEAVIMRDRTTGRARGFGFVVFANPCVADKVVRERHVIDGRTVEAKKAVPRDDHQTFIKSNGSLHGSPGPTRTRKIFVGGLASTVTENDFKKYFDQFGTITDVVVMYDHNTLRPRGFGFITYDSEESVDRVLVKTFHELNGKMVEVKRAVPKELSPGPARSPSSVYSYGSNRTSSFINSYSSGNNNKNLNPIGGSGMRIDSPFSPVTADRSGSGNQSMGLDLESGLGCRNGMYYSYFGENLYKNDSLISTTNQNAWGNVNNPNYTPNSMTSNNFLSPEIGNGGLVGGFGNIGEIWGGSRVSSKGRENIVYRGVHDNYDGVAGYTRGNGGSTSLSSNTDRGAGNLNGGNSFFTDHGWHSSFREFAESDSFIYGRENPTSDVGSNGYIRDYSDTRSNRRIAA